MCRERRSLQRFERGELRPRRLTAAARALEGILGGELRGAGRLNACLRRGERRSRRLAVRARL